MLILKEFKFLKMCSFLKNPSILLVFYGKFATIQRENKKKDFFVEEI